MFRGTKLFQGFDVINNVYGAINNNLRNGMKEL
jgi:hypothetical protein